VHHKLFSDPCEWRIVFLLFCLWACLQVLNAQLTAWTPPVGEESIHSGHPVQLMAQLILDAISNRSL
jgi:hypothetical protein